MSENEVRFEVIGELERTSRKLKSIGEQSKAVTLLDLADGLKPKAMAQAGEVM